MSYDKLKSLIANVNAIETAMAVRLEKRKAKPTEKRTFPIIVASVKQRKSLTKV